MSSLFLKSQPLEFLHFCLIYQGKKVLKRLLVLFEVRDNDSYSFFDILM